MTKSRRITIEFMEVDPNDLSRGYGGFGCSSSNFDQEGRCTRVEVGLQTGTEDTSGYTTTTEYKKGHISDAEAAKLVKNLVNGSSTKSKLLFKSLKSEPLFSAS